jgi:putative heme transporter
MTRERRRRRAPPPGRRRGVPAAVPVVPAGPAPGAPRAPTPAASPDGAPPAAPAAAPDDVVCADLDLRSLGVPAAVMVGAVVALDLARAVDDTVVHVLFALVGALALDRLVRLVERSTRLPRPPAVAVVVAFAAGAAAVVATLLVPAVVEQAGRLGDQAPDVLADLAELPLVGQSLEENDVPAQALAWVEAFPDRMAGNADALLGTAQAAALQAAGAVTTLLLLVLLLIEGPGLAAAGRRLLPPRWRGSADAVGRSVYVVLGRYAAGSVFLALMAGTAAFLIGVAMEVPLVPLAALWAVLWNFVPQLGGVMGGALLVALALSSGVTSALVVLVLWLVYMQLENRVVQPVVVGRAVQLSPLTTMVVALLGVAVAGLAGAVLAIPLVAAVNAARLELRGTRR